MWHMLFMNRVSPAKFVWGENKNWAIANKTNGSYSFISGVIGATTGCVKNFFDKESLSYKFLGFIQSVILGIRNYFQYSIYSRKKDDDLGEDCLIRPHAANIGEIGCFFEKKINPFVLPLSYLINERLYEGYSSIAHLFNALWWRIRLFSTEINLNEIRKSLTKDLKYILSSDLEEREEARKSIVNCFPQFLGLLGFFTIGLFTPIKSWLKLKGEDNKLINCLNSLGVTTQHIAYLFKFTLPAHFRSLDLEPKDSSILATLGFAANTMNIALPLVEALPIENEGLIKVQNLYRELASGFTMAFFSKRRNIMGRRWLEMNCG